MTSSPRPSRHEGTPPPATELGRRLDALMGSALVPDEIDRAMVGRIEGHWTEEVATRRRTGGWGMRLAGLAAAAMLAGAIWVFGPWSPPASPPATVSVARSGDMDGDGVVDILDAYLLGRQLASSTTVDRHQDLTGDGLVDEADVHAIARRAVTLSGETNS